MLLVEVGRDVEIWNEKVEKKKEKVNTLLAIYA
jgi:hypothetical protein